MRTLMTSSALVLMLANPALATSDDTAQKTAPLSATATASATTPIAIETEIFVKQADVNDMFGSNLIGKPLYASERDATGLDKTALDQDWDNVGEINDLLLGADGEVKAVMLDIGGFLGIGEKTVAVDMSELSFISDGENPDDYFVTVALSTTMLENAPEFIRASADETTAQATDTMMTSDMWTRPTTARDGYMMISDADVTADNLLNAPIYGAGDAQLGEIEELVIEDNGTVKAALVDVGGFLGLGEKRIEISYDELQIMREDDGDALRIFVSATQDQLEERPEIETNQG
ncbi:PRC-barrel domain-containing protein [Pacificibacter marinus]|uniref:PRC-barrel domain-containing protein n=1 Tax=Pacificibacter marinus TaxID=658057 RepID=UPI001C06CC17|nr:PRC-barrel domain-containing protein [Pacificibacter marinus]MBU2867789.1 PRC-barrel domain-containing protein [Pacificibacter marinus]